MFLEAKIQRRKLIAQACLTFALVAGESAWDGSSQMAWAGAPAKVYQGNVSQNELVDNLERLGIKCEIHEGASHSLIVSTVRMGSNAFFKGVTAGDAVKGLSNNNGQFLLTIDRGGKTYQLSLRPMAAATDSSLLAGQAKQTTLNGAVGEKVARIDLHSLNAKTAANDPHIVDISPKVTPIVDIGQTSKPIVEVDAKEKERKLVQYDIELILDITGSMADADGTGSYSKFQWCHEQVRTIAQKLAPYSKTFTITTFNNTFDVMENCNPTKVEEIYSNIRPNGGTDLVDPLMNRCEAALDRQKHWGKPQLIAIISDGMPNIPRDPMTVNRALVEFSKKLQSKEDVTITFLQIGDEFAGRDFCIDLDQNLTHEGAKFDLVHTKTFDELKREGIINALIDAIVDNSSGAATTALKRPTDRYRTRSNVGRQLDKNLNDKIKQRKELERQLFSTPSVPETTSRGNE